MRNEKPILYGIIGLLIGIVLTVIIVSNAVNTHNTSMMQMMGMHQKMNQQQTPSGMHKMPGGEMMKNDSMEVGDDSMTMTGMVGALKGKRGEEFDREFIKQMIPHHQGAIDMAKLAEQYAGHDELKQLAVEIIEAQTKEINMMQGWQANWGY